MYYQEKLQISVFLLQKSNIKFVYYYYLVKEYEYWKQHKYGQYCTPLTQSDCRYFFVLAIKSNIHTSLYTYLSSDVSIIALKLIEWKIRFLFSNFNIESMMRIGRVVELRLRQRGHHQQKDRQHRIMPGLCTIYLQTLYKQLFIFKTNRKLLLSFL